MLEITTMGFMEITTLSSNVTRSNANVSEILNAQAYVLYRIAQWLDDYSTYILTAVALVLNSAAFFTICSMKPINSTSIYIATLAIVDTLCLLLKLLVTRLVKIPSLPEEFSCGFLLSFFFFVQYMSSFLIVTISTERFVAVWFPFRVNQVFTKRAAFLSILGLSLLSFGLSVWVFWFYDRVHHGMWGHICLANERYSSAMAIIKRAHPLVYIVIPLIVVFILNIAIIVGLRRSVRWAMFNGDCSVLQTRIGHRLTIMLVTTCFTFLVLEIPMACLGLFKYFYPKETFVDDIFYVEVAQTLEDTNHAINFVLYFLSGSKFRRWFMSMVSGRSCRHNSAQQHAALTLLTSSRHSCGGGGTHHELVPNTHPPQYS